jgi:hypothetical protein
MTLVPAFAILIGANQTRGANPMLSALLHVRIPDQSRPQKDYENFVREARQLQLPSGVDTLAENVWLVEIPDHQPLLTQLIALAKKHAIACRSLEVDTGPTWRSYP